MNIKLGSTILQLIPIGFRVGYMTLGLFGIGTVVASIGASVGALYLLQYMYGKREQSGQEQPGL